MTVAALQQFLRSLGAALESADAGSAAGEVVEAAAALEPFRAIEVTAFAAFLVRAREYQASGQVPAPGPGEEHVARLAAVLGLLPAATDNFAGLQREAADALQQIAGRAGLKGKLTADPKWAQARAQEARIVPHRAALAALAARITSPTGYDDPGIRDEMARLADRIDLASLKALGAEHGVRVTAKALPEKVVGDLLAKLSGHLPPKAKPVGRVTAVDPAAVEENARRLAGLIERSVDPTAVGEIEVEAELDRLKGLSPAALLEVVTRVGIREARPGESKTALLKRVRNELTAARRARERAGA